ncbi:MAG TPA: hypothetical protein VFY27_12300, partial [Woeseiaceae bacterium]|nr:hypothetical protein [Woeseiaceae bacterium]
KVTSSLIATTITLPLLMVSQLASSQSEQVLSEVGAMGKLANGRQGVVIPDFSNETSADYSEWVALATGRDFKSFAISFRGTALVLDGTMIREFNSAGQELMNAGFPVDCKKPFPITKSSGQPGTDSLSTCTAFTPLNDGTIRIAGQSKGKSLVMVGYDPESGQMRLKASGTPPSISDMDGDEYADSDDRKGAGYWAIGDKKKIIFFPLNNENNFEVVATINGVDLDAITPFGPHRLIVALTTGELREVNTASGVSTSKAFLPTGADCQLGRRDPQKFSLRGDPSGVLFVGNMGCREITLFDSNLQQVAASDSFSGNPFELNNPSPFFVSGLDWQSGQGGDFGDCDGLTETDGCKFGIEPRQAVMWEVENVGSDTSYRMFQFVNLDDCRWSGNRPCPILNCPSADGKGAACPVTDKKEQVLDLAQVLIRADQSGVFEEMAFGDGPVPEMALPGYMRGEECFPSSGDSNVCVPNNYRFHSFFAVTDAVFTGNFFTDYKIDEFRVGSDDPCLIPEPESTIEEVNETANLIVYNTDSFGTVDRGGVQGRRGGVIVNDACNGRAGGYKWSSQTIGLELYDDDNPEAYIDQANRMMGELIQAKEELLCAPFPDDSSLGPLLLGSDCNSIGGELSQMESKLATCFDSLYAPQSGNSAENCSAFFTKVQNLNNVLDASAWPVPNTTNLDVLRPNYEGEFRARLATLVFFIQSYVLNSVPPGGIILP